MIPVTQGPKIVENGPELGFLWNFEPSVHGMFPLIFVYQQ
jgi:hypothetical protein